VKTQTVGPPTGFYLPTRMSQTGLSVDSPRRSRASLRVAKDGQSRLTVEERAPVQMSEEKSALLPLIQFVNMLEQGKPLHVPATTL